MKSFTQIKEDVGFLTEGADKKLLELNADRKPGQHKVNTSNGKENTKTTILSASKNHVTYVLKSGSDVSLYHSDTSGQTIIDLDSNEVAFLKKAL
ncbi:hypothetical protein vBAbaMPhT2_126 [Acinetobacter phage vB_AbaM_PhT2]|uniref:Uncharacterized protein n=1 Tax=Acinetobacter phage vB_AbaM_PhT2 TaxID=2690230 RepID=A0A6B9SYT8_9CAUD|nr:hypothetical protein HYQ24_gp126 [Acinetobacter phage vB_AbaM_PhT2]QHJ75738.1 hypothetical protein vBAbaMPhT2_126 [Acinetobacter phage vB_AbaM_PhT2]